MLDKNSLLRVLGILVLSKISEGVSCPKPRENFTVQ